MHGRQRHRPHTVDVAIEALPEAMSTLEASISCEHMADERVALLVAKFGEDSVKALKGHGGIVMEAVLSLFGDKDELDALTPENFLTCGVRVGRVNIMFQDRQGSFCCMPFRFKSHDCVLLFLVCCCVFCVILIFISACVLFVIGY